jgi:hypothetical protein
VIVRDSATKTSRVRHLERSLSALLPVSNAESTLSEQVSEMLDILPELTRRLELVLIDDGSTDATIEVADELALVYPQLVIARHAVPLGRVAAIRTGLARSVGEVIFLADSPCALALNELCELWQAIRDHELVLGKCRAWNTQWGFVAAIPQVGGYLLGRRPAFGQLAGSLEDDGSLLTQLRQSGQPWHEVAVSPRAASIRRLDTIHAGVGPRDRTGRANQGEHPAAGHGGQRFPRR